MSADAVPQEEDMKLFLLASLPKTPVCSLPAGTASVLSEIEFSCRNVYDWKKFAFDLIVSSRSKFLSQCLSLETRQDSACPRWAAEASCKTNSIAGDGKQWR
jgi:hypothetical protein